MTIHESIVRNFSRIFAVNSNFRMTDGRGVPIESSSNFIEKSRCLLQVLSTLIVQNISVHLKRESLVAVYALTNKNRKIRVGNGPLGGIW